jgi:5S rRNA maturation endonuclease (ribonuclease M5)
MLLIKGYRVDVDIARELLRYEWRTPRWTGTKFLACSPFRSERHPSFAVRLDNGVWIDSGSSNEEWKRGHFIKLLAWLRNETWAETGDYLLLEYGLDLGDVDALKLRLDLDLDNKATEQEPLEKSILREYLFRHPYLGRRGIGERVQRQFRIGYDRRHRAVTFPWYDKAGNLINVKFRSVDDKRFWYFGDGLPIKKHLYGLDHIHRVRAQRAFIVESEIDALTLWEQGYVAVALGGANLTPRQRDLLIQSPVEELVVATDNDRAGEEIARTITFELNGYLTVKRLDLPDHIKDINELTPKELKLIIRE